MPHYSEVRFATLEMQLKALRTAHQMTQFIYALESLPPNVVVSVRDLELNASKDYPYDRLKAALLRDYLPSSEERL